MNKGHITGIHVIIACRNSEANNFMHPRLTQALVSALICMAVLAGCSHFPSSGFLRSAVEPPSNPNLNGIQFVEITDPVARQLLLQRTHRMFSDTLGSAAADTERVRPGDVLEVSVWEAPPSSLFAGGTDTKGMPSSSRVTTLPEQMVNKQGFINVPFAGQVQVAGNSTSQIEAEIIRKLKGMANQPQVMVRRTRNLSSDVTVVGEVTASARVPLTPRGERLLDALAATGGVRQPVNKMTIQVTRGDSVHALPLESIIRDPKQNVPLQPGDVVTALYQPLSFTALGATGRNEEINFEAQGISLAQALARAGGTVDTRADVKGVFIFRFEREDALAWPRQPAITTPDGRVPVIYRLDLGDPASFFVAQSFPISNQDVLYISNASMAELQKFLNIVSTVLYPAAVFRSLNR